VHSTGTSNRKRGADTGWGDLTGPGGAAKGNPKYGSHGVTRYWRYTKEKMDELIRLGRVVQTTPVPVPAYKRYLTNVRRTNTGYVDRHKPIGAQAAERMVTRPRNPRLCSSVS